MTPVGAWDVQASPSVPAEHFVPCTDYCKPEHIGHEVRGVYDGVLYWSCPRTNKAWPRWDDGGRLSEKGRFYAEKFLEGGGHVRN